MRRLKRLAGDEEAAELVEFAISAWILFMLLFGIIEFCILIYSESVVAYAAQQGARYWMVRGADWAKPNGAGAQSVQHNRTAKVPLNDSISEAPREKAGRGRTRRDLTNYRCRLSLQGKVVV